MAHIGWWSAEQREALRAAIAAEDLLFRRLRQQREAVDRWRRREALARQRGLDDLARAAAQRLARERAEELRLAEEYERFRRDVEHLKADYRRGSRGKLRGVTIDMGLTVEERFRRLERDDLVERQLADLKARLQGAQGGTPGGG